MKKGKKKERRHFKTVPYRDFFPSCIKIPFPFASHTIYKVHNYQIFKNEGEGNNNNVFRLLYPV